jgi:hypothetical protein
MAITNGYCTLEELKPELRIPLLLDTTDDLRLEVAIGRTLRRSSLTLPSPAGRGDQSSGSGTDN